MEINGVTTGRSTGLGGVHCPFLWNVFFVQRLISAWFNLRHANIGLLTVGLYEKCNTTNDCSQTTDGRTTQCLHGVCLCEYGYRPTPDKHNCVLEAGLGETCNTTEDCMQARNNISTECWKDACTCQTGFKPTPGMRDCVRVVIGDTCENNRECYVTNGTRTCDKNVCQCDPSFVRSKKYNNTCLKVAELDAFCEEDHQCMAENVRCDVPRCVCKKGYKWENSKCVSSQDTPYCKSKEECNDLWEAPDISDCIDNACHCTGGSEFVEARQTCECKDGYVVVRTECLPVASGLGSVCVEDGQCIELRKIDPFGDCNVNEECEHISNMVCRENICTCGERYLISPDQKSCIPYLKSLQDHCKFDTQCHEAFGNGSFCRTRCICKNDFHKVNNTKCVRNRGMGEECSSSYDCYMETDVRILQMICHEGKCTIETQKTINTSLKNNRNTGTHALKTSKLLAHMFLFLIMIL